VLFVYREEYYLERSDKRDGPEHDAARGRAELIVAKQRHGPTGSAYCQFDGRYTRFSGVPAERCSVQEAVLA
jgi:replicative DNA helicase